MDTRLCCMLGIEPPLLGWANRGTSKAQVVLTSHDPGMRRATVQNPDSWQTRGGNVLCDALMKSLLSALHVDALPMSVILVSRLRLPSHRTQPHVYPYVVMLY